MVTTERLVCETKPHAAADNLPVTVSIFKTPGGYERSRCRGTCVFSYKDNNTPYWSWMYPRAVTQGDTLAFGGQTGALKGVASWDSLIVRVGLTTCDMDALQVYNPDNELVTNKRIANCKLLSLFEPGFVNLSAKVLPIALNDVACPNFACIPEFGGVGSTNGYGIAARQHYSGTNEFANYIHPETYEPYDMVVYPRIDSVYPRSGGALGGNTLTIRGRGFSVVASANTVTVGGPL
jgi:hypothetical protein